ncbi:pSer/pThr/pTyr-binding forkhead associated (FHA) protein [Spirosoma lacussanchae]|uniref:FHA domain-containing protein n=1 Tax=Spirosoma lacussanchae TaxID=1884249 RepID=UPI001108FC48|nr:FHA domain-containing protein [Spirosoma lacussanchae]
MPSLTRNDSQLEQLIDDLSQLPAYTIGRRFDNQIVIANARVSGYHARLIRCTPTTFVLEDLASKNGSFVHGTRIVRKIVDRHDTVRLADVELTISELLALRKPDPVMPVAEPTPPPAIPEATANPLDFTIPFADLRQVFEQYPNLRRDCRNREKMIRTGSVLLSSVVGIGAVLSTGGLAFTLLSSAGLGMLVPTLCSTLLSTDEKLELIDKEYRERYRCPNPSCRDPFGNREWELLAHQKVCRRCQAIWVR